MAVKASRVRNQLLLDPPDADVRRAVVDFAQGNLEAVPFLTLLLRLSRNRQSLPIPVDAVQVDLDGKAYVDWSQFDPETILGESTPQELGGASTQMISPHDEVVHHLSLGLRNGTLVLGIARGFDGTFQRSALKPDERRNVLGVDEIAVKTIHGPVALRMPSRFTTEWDNPRVRRDASSSLPIRARTVTRGARTLVECLDSDSDSDSDSGRAAAAVEPVLNDYLRRADFAHGGATLQEAALRRRNLAQLRIASYEGALTWVVWRTVLYNTLLPAATDPERLPRLDPDVIERLELADESTAFKVYKSAYRRATRLLLDPVVASLSKWESNRSFADFVEGLRGATSEAVEASEQLWDALFPGVPYDGSEPPNAENLDPELKDLADELLAARRPGVPLARNSLAVRMLYESTKTFLGPIEQYKDDWRHLSGRRPTPMDLSQPQLASLLEIASHATRIEARTRIRSREPLFRIDRDGEPSWIIPPDGDGVCPGAPKFRVGRDVINAFNRLTGRRASDPEHIGADGIQGHAVACILRQQMPESFKRLQFDVSTPTFVVPETLG
jgi:hypothetical protein